MLAFRVLVFRSLVFPCRIPALASEDRCLSSRSSSKKDSKKRRRHPVAKVKGNWVLEEDLRLIR